MEYDCGVDEVLIMMCVLVGKSSYIEVIIICTLLSCLVGRMSTNFIYYEYFCDERVTCYQRMFF